MSLNLLSEKYKSDLRFERWTRFVLISGFLFGSIGVLFIVLLLPSFFFLFFQERALNSTLSEGTGDLQAAVTELQDELRGYNTTIIDLHAAAPESQRSYIVIADITERAGTTITFQSLAYNADTHSIALKGKAATRADLREFTSRLEESKFIDEVISPPENFLASTDVTFQLTIKLTP